MSKFEEEKYEEITQPSILDITIPEQFTEGDTITVRVSGSMVSSADSLEITGPEGSNVKFPHSGEFTEEHDYESPMEITVENAQKGQYAVVSYEADWSTVDFEAGIYEPIIFDKPMGYAVSNTATVLPANDQDQGQDSEDSNSGETGDGTDQTSGFPQNLPDFKGPAMIILAVAIGIALWRWNQ